MTKDKEGIFLDSNRRLYQDQYRGLWVDSKIAAAALGVGIEQLYRSVRAGRCSVRWLRIGNLLRFSARDLDISSSKSDLESPL